MTDPDDTLTIGQAAKLAGKHPTTVKRALSRGAFPGAARGEGASAPWRIPRDELDALYGPLDAPPDAPEHPAGPDAPSAAPSASVALPYSDLAPLLQRLTDAEHDRANAERDARVAEHRAEQLRGRARALPWAVVLAAAIGLVLGAAVAAAALG